MPFRCFFLERACLLQNCGVLPWLMCGGVLMRACVAVAAQQKERCALQRIFACFARALFFCVFGMEAVSLVEPDVQIIYYPVVGPARCAGFSKDQPLFVTSVETGERCHLCDLMLDQVSAGYHVVSGINPVRCYSPLVLDERVHDVLCEKRDFCSEDMWRCFECIENALERGLGVDPTLPHKMLQAEDVRKRIYVKGETREWSVVQANRVGRSVLCTLVFVIFPKEDKALEGISWDKKDMKSTTSTGSLLHLRRQIERLSELGAPMATRCSQRPLGEGPSLWEFVQNDDCFGRGGIGVIYFSDSGMKSALFDVSRERVRARYEWDGSVCEKKNVSLFSYIHDEILMGCILLRPVKDAADISLLQHPDVRDLVCAYQPFFSRVLAEHLPMTFANLLRMPEGCFSGDGWGGLNPHHLYGMYRDGQTVQWSPVQRKLLLGDDTRLRAFPVGTMLILLHKEPMAFQGKVVSASRASRSAFCPKNSLAEHQKKQIVREAVDAGIKNRFGFRRVYSLDGL